MRCLLMCVFIREYYIDLCLILLESIKLYGELSEEEEIVIYTSSAFRDKMIKENVIISELPIIFEVNDNYTTQTEACCARLNFFNLRSSERYECCLYLDVDIIIKGDIKELFKFLEKDVLYVCPEGKINKGSYPSDHWGRSLFGSDLELYEDKAGFTTGILLFNNCKVLEELFECIKMDISTSPFKFECEDQPFIIYHAFTKGLYDNKKLKDYVVNACMNIYSRYTIHHFPGGIYNLEKIRVMLIFLENLKKYKWKNKRIDLIDVYPDQMTCSNVMRNDIGEFLKDKKLTVAELGSYLGYTSKYLADISSHVYCVDNDRVYLERNKNNNKREDNMSYILFDLYKDDWGELSEEMLNSVEVVFIDAYHEYENCKSDILNSIKYFPKLKYLIMDDYGIWSGVKKIVHELLIDNVVNFEKYIGLYEVPYRNGDKVIVYKNTHEGVILSINS